MKNESPTESTKYYFTSSRRLRQGAFLWQTESTWYDSTRLYGVFLTTSPIPHYTMVERVLKTKKPWFVYEVEPLGRMEYGRTWEEVVAAQGRIVKFIGNARSILANHTKRFVAKDNFRNGSIGSKVRPDVHVRGLHLRGRGVPQHWPV